MTTTHVVVYGSLSDCLIKWFSVFAMDRQELSFVLNYITIFGSAKATASLRRPTMKPHSPQICSSSRKYNHLGANAEVRALFGTAAV
jgi:hypothetical protein